ncbi:MAG: ComF family protein [Planctomycetes bacterium]|nr:ComF family protein [Planctomycetota bacterium]
MTQVPDELRPRRSTDRPMSLLDRVVTRLSSSSEPVPFERDWLGVTSAPARVLMADSDWLPDAAGEDYCPRCGSSIGIGEFDGTSCGSCRHSRLPWGRLIRLGRYEGDLRDWVHEIKFKRNDHLARALGRELGRQLVRAGIGSGDVVPIPTPALRRIRRGIDHTAGIAHGVCRTGAYRIRRHLKRSYRPVQRAVAPSSRRSNVSGTFSARRRWLGAGIPDRVILIDDVMTTGATMRAACRELKRAGAKQVVCVVLAVVDNPQRQ